MQYWYKIAYSATLLVKFNQNANEIDYLRGRKRQERWGNERENGYRKIKNTREGEENRKKREAERNDERLINTDIKSTQK